MSEGTVHKSHAMTWVLSMLAVLLLYAASWPVVEIKASPYTIVGVRSDHGPIEARVPPNWINVLYRPIHFLNDLNERHNFLVQYYWWWEFRLEDRDGARAPSP